MSVIEQLATTLQRRRARVESHFNTAKYLQVAIADNPFSLQSAKFYEYAINACTELLVTIEVDTAVIP